ncbi:MAG: flagellin [Acidobacteria bacterium]|nr:flagellin [Acidobacteriota bacterium]
MAISILNNIGSLFARNQLSFIRSSLQNTLFRLASGSRINSGADDAAGLAIADGLRANVTALQQSSRNANDGVGVLQVADGGLGQVNNLLNRAVTLSTQAATSTLSDSQRAALNAEYTAIKDEIDRIGSSTTFNGSSVFTASTTSVFLSDGTASSTIGTTVGTLSSAGLGLATDISTAANASTALGEINTAVSTVSTTRGTVGASINRLDSASNVINNQILNLQAAEDGIRAADIAKEVANLTRFSILSQTNTAALAQANLQQRQILALLE